MEEENLFAAVVGEAMQLAVKGRQKEIRIHLAGFEPDGRSIFGASAAGGEHRQACQQHSGNHGLTEYSIGSHGALLMLPQSHVWQ